MILIFMSLNIFGLNESKKFNYPLDVVYSTMIRYLIVDENAEIIQKDIEGAYIKFNSKDKKISGVIEIIKIDKKKSKLIVNFEGAHYKMVLFFKKFDKKITDEQDNLKK